MRYDILATGFVGTLSLRGIIAGVVCFAIGLLIGVLFLGKRRKKEGVVLDISAFMDGRIDGMIKSNFFNWELYVPTFVLEELERKTAGSGYERLRARLAVRVLKRLVDEGKVKMVKTGRDVGVKNDSRIIRLAGKLGAKVLAANNYELVNLGNVHKVKVLDVEVLARKMKPLTLPGEKVTLRVEKKGKEPTQGIGYLSDGTMVVLEGGSKLIGQTVECVITNIFETETSRMLFAKQWVNNKKQER